MGFIDDLLGVSPSHRVSKSEMQEIRSRLYDLDEQERDEIEMLFRADLDEEGMQAGISKEEAAKGIAWLRDNMKKHHLESADIDKLEGYLIENLKD